MLCNAARTTLARGGDPEMHCDSLRKIPNYGMVGTNRHFGSQPLIEYQLLYATMT
jgi:hypothetical protein